MLLGEFSKVIALVVLEWIDCPLPLIDWLRHAALKIGLGVGLLVLIMQVILDTLDGPFILALEFDVELGIRLVQLENFIYELLFDLNLETLGQVIDQKVECSHTILIDSDIHIYIFIDSVVFLLVEVDRIYYFQLHLLHNLYGFLILFIEQRILWQLPIKNSDLITGNITRYLNWTEYFLK